MLTLKRSEDRAGKNPTVSSAAKASTVWSTHTTVCCICTHTDWCGWGGRIVAIERKHVKKFRSI